MSGVLIIAGLVLMVAGAVYFLLPPPAPTAAAQGVAADAAKILEEINKLLDKLDKRYRPGLVLMIVGLVLVGAGLYLATLDAKEAAEAALALGL